MLSDMGAEIFSVKIVYPNSVETSPYFESNIQILDLSYAEKILGIRIRRSDAVRLLEKMGHMVEGYDGKMVRVLVPPYRVDIFHQIDLVDDIARAYGFDNFEPELTPVFTTAARLMVGEIVDFLRDILVGLGFSEVFTFSLTSTEDQFEKMRIKPTEKYVRLAGAKEARLNMVRIWLLPEALKSLAENKAKEYPIKIFEIEDVVEISEDLEAQACNKKHLVILISNTGANYTQIKSCVEYIFSVLGHKIRVTRENHESFITGRCAAIYIDDRKVGIMGEVHPEVLQNFGLTMPTVAAEIDLSEVLGLKVREVEWA